MTFKTLLAVHPTHEPVSSLAPIAALAKHLEAHLEVVILSALYPLPTMIVAESPGFVWSESLPDLVRKSEDRAREISEFIEPLGISFSTDIEAQQAGLVGKAVAIPALTSDLVIVSRAASLITGIMAQSLEGALFDAGKPVLVLGNPADSMTVEPDNVMIAWDGSREAARAVHHALNFLKTARTVNIVSIEEHHKESVKGGWKPLARHLAHHGVKAEFHMLPANGHTTSHTLVDYVGKQTPELLVMGAYGHTRLRELIFSGSTRSALEAIESAVLLAH